MNDSERLGRAIAALELIKGEVDAFDLVSTRTKLRVIERIVNATLEQIREEPK